MATGAESFLTSVRVICPSLTEHELAQFASRLALKELKKRDLFVQAGKIQRAIGFISTGQSLKRSSDVASR